MRRCRTARRRGSSRNFEYLSAARLPSSIGHAAAHRSRQAQLQTLARSSLALLYPGWVHGVMHTLCLVQLARMQRSVWFV